MPYHGQGKTPDHEINQEIGHAVPPVELVLVDTSASANGLVPVKRHRLAFQYCDEEADDEVQKDNGQCCSQHPSEPANDSKDSIVEEDERGFDGNGGGEV